MIKRATVRVWQGSDSEGVVGGGFLVAPNMILTCAHVIASALGVDEPPENWRPPEGATVMLDFPLVAPGKRFPARLVTWRRGDRDTAALEIDPAAAKGIPPARLAPMPDYRDGLFQAFGFPAGFPQGRYESGPLCGLTADGMVEIRPTDSHKYFVEQGFSGTPASVGKVVVGMVVATGPKPEDRLAYLLPITDLERAWPPLATPYRGLAAFNEDSARWFRGRDEFTTRILDKLAVEPVVAVVGASGSGKSSVVRAGVMPRLKEQGWRVAACRIGERPFYHLARALAVPLYGPLDAGTLTDKTLELEQRFRGGNALDYVSNLLAKTQMFILLDQFEELVTLTPEAERAGFDTLLGCLIKTCCGSGLRLALTLRSDYVDTIETLGCARHLLNNAQVRLTPMNRHELAQAVGDPARELGVGFADGIDGDLIGQVARTASLLPLLQYTLQELWRTQDQGVITEAALQKCGGLEGVLSQSADKVLKELSEDDREQARILFTRHLVTLTEGGITHDTKRTARRAELDESLWRVA